MIVMQFIWDMMLQSWIFDCNVLSRKWWKSFERHFFLISWDLDTVCLTWNSVIINHYRKSWNHFSFMVNLLLITIWIWITNSGCPSHYIRGIYKNQYFVSDLMTFYCSLKLVYTFNIGPLKRSMIHSNSICNPTCNHDHTTTLLQLCHILHLLFRSNVTSFLFL